MNDYIDHLIGRSLNKAHVIQPRLPAIFEPQTNDEPVFYKRKVDIEPSYHSSKEDVLIASLPETDKQISYANPVIKSIKTGKNDLRSHKSDLSESGIQKDLTRPDKSELEESTPSLNITRAKTEYPVELRDTIADKNVPDENVTHDIPFEPYNKPAENPDLIRPTNFIDQTIETESITEESILKKVATQKLEDKTLEKNPVIKSIKTGKNDLRSHKSDLSESGIQKDLTRPDKSELEESTPSLNITRAKTEYPVELRDTIADKNVPDENVTHDIPFEPYNKPAENPDLIRPTNFIDQTIETESITEESILKKVATQKLEDKTLEKINDRFTPSHSSNNEITIQQYEEKTKSRSDHRLDGRLNSNSNIKNINHTLSFSKKHSDQKNGLQNPNDPESASGPFKGKLVTGSGIQWNNQTSLVNNDNLEQQESVIRVNIGRIEVRAVQPPTPPPQPQSKQFKPILSLDDYLSQRNGG